MFEYPVCSEERFYELIKCYGKTLVPVPLQYYHVWSEEQIILSRAISKFHHLIILDAF
jgi:hypothetical protein